MGKGQLNLCGQCKVNCGSNSVFCFLCALWFHAKCEEISFKDVSMLKKANRGYICSSCADNNYEMSLARITEAAKCYSYLEKIVRRESVIMRKPFIVTDQLPTIHVYFQRNIDTVTHMIKEKYGIMPLRKPLFVSGDGNCLFNAVSVSLCGSQKLAAELRVRTVIEMVMNADKYKNCSDAKIYLTLAPNYKDACVDCGKNGAFSSVWTILALSTVIERPIHSVYPPCNGTEGSNGFIYRALNSTFPKDGNSKIQPIYIMWTSTTEHHKGLWSPNHFVPLISLTDVPGIPTETSDTPETNFSASSPTYQQDFPDLSSSLDFENSSKNEMPSHLLQKKEDKLSRESTSSWNMKTNPSAEKLDRQQTSIIASALESHQNFPDFTSSSDLENSPKRQKLSNLPENKKADKQKDKANCNSTPINNDANDCPSIIVTPVQRKFSWSLNQNIATPDEHVCSDEDNIESNKSKRPNVELVADEHTNHALGVFVAEESFVGVNDSKYLSDEEIAADNTESDTDQSQSDSEEGVNENIECIRKGFTAQQIYNLVMNQSDILPSVPKGIKSNCYFVVNNEENVKKNDINENCEYHDDCGVWDSSATRTIDMAYVVNNGKLQYIRKKDEMYCTKKMISKKEMWKPLDPQPDKNDIVVLRKYYTTLQRNSAYVRHVSWFKKMTPDCQEKRNIAVFEYFGSYPNTMSFHGRTKIKNKQYVRMDPKTKQKVKEKLQQNVKVRTIFKDLQKEDHETAPRDYKAIQYLKQKEKKKTSSVPNGNLADEMLEVFKLLREHPFVQEVRSTKDHAPTIILYLEDQIKDFQFFASKKSGHVVGVDRTFNLGATFVTCFTYTSHLGQHCFSNYTRKKGKKKKRKITNYGNNH